MTLLFLHFGEGGIEIKECEQCHQAEQEEHEQHRHLRADIRQDIVFRSKSKIRGTDESMSYRQGISARRRISLDIVIGSKQRKTETNSTIL